MPTLRGFFISDFPSLLRSVAPAGTLSSGHEKPLRKYRTGIDSVSNISFSVTSHDNLPEWQIFHNTVKRGGERGMYPPYYWMGGEGDFPPVLLARGRGGRARGASRKSPILTHYPYLIARPAGPACRGFGLRPPSPSLGSNRPLPENRRAPETRLQVRRCEAPGHFFASAKIKGGMNF